MKKKNGTVYKTTWINNKKEGRGVKIEDGYKEEGTYRNDVFIPITNWGSSSNYNETSNKRGGYFPGLGKIDENGEIRDDNGRLVGRIDDDGEVRDENGRKRGKIYDDGEVRDEDGRKIGKMYKDGDIVDADGNKLGKVYDGGDVVDKDGNLLGRMQGNNKDAAAHFFFK